MRNTDRLRFRMIKKSPGGGIGRRARFRCEWFCDRAGSSPVLGTSQNRKNAILYIVALIMLICYALFAALFFVLYRFLSPVLAFVVAVPLFVYTDQVILITTLTYFQKTI